MELLWDIFLSFCADFRSLQTLLNARTVKPYTVSVHLFWFPGNQIDVYEEFCTTLFFLSHDLHKKESIKDSCVSFCV